MKLLKGFLSCVKSKKALAAATSCFLLFSGSMTAFAAVPYEMSSTMPAASSSFLDSLPTITISYEMLRPIIDSVVANIYPALSAGIPICAILIGFRIVPMVISKLASG